MLKIPPSRPGYDFATADLSPSSPAAISTLAINRILAKASQQAAAGADPDLTSLVAQLVKQSAPRNSNWIPRTYNFDTYNRQQILANDINRSTLIIQNVGSGDIFVLFENSDPQLTDLSGSASGILELTNASKRSLQIIAGGNLTPYLPPNNAVTLFSLNVAAQGIVISG